jgi:ABC-type uncharacterized transport system auxiliary subunit
MRMKIMIVSMCLAALQGCASTQALTDEKRIEIVEHVKVIPVVCSVEVDRPTFPKISDGKNLHERASRMVARDIIKEAYIDKLEEGLKSCGGVVHVK